MGSERGFTLIELMVVVGIVGVLVTLAVPNYARYQAKARQAEAKIHLAHLYIAEQSAIAEQASYTACLRDIGIGPDMAGSAAVHFYAYGFSQNASTTNPPGCGPAGGLACNQVFSGHTPRACTDITQYTDTGLGYQFPTTVASNVQINANAVVQGGTSSVGINVNAQLSTGTMDGGSDPTSISSTAFVAVAGGNISKSSTLPLDVWTIDQTRSLANLLTGL